MHDSCVHDTWDVAMKRTGCMPQWEVRTYLSVADVAQRRAPKSSKGSPLDLHHQNSDFANLANP